MAFLDGKSVLITGGTGSFGKAFVRAVLDDHKPTRVVVLSRDELKQEEMRQQFQSHPDVSRLRFFIGDIRDRDRLYRAFRGIDMVVHAAAMKQVPACEYNPHEAVQTNIEGTKNVIDAAIDIGVDRVFAISTDKAVNPINLYGATKLCAEKIIVQANAYSSHGGTKFSCSRYGNVVGSRGSVVPFFVEQRDTGTLTVTDERMTRFWITLKQGVEFVLNCMEDMHGGEIFVPRIPSMNIMEIAKAIGPDCEIKIVGVRPGEKLHEVMVSEDESRHTLEFDDKFVIMPLHPWWGGNGWSGGKSLPDGFRYVSDTNTEWLTADDLRQMLK